MIPEQDGIPDLSEYWKNNAEEKTRPAITTKVHNLVDEKLPEDVLNTVFPRARVELFRETNCDSTEYTAIFRMPLTPFLWWTLLQTSAPYKSEWPSAVSTDWGMYQQFAASHGPALGAAWDDLIPHLDVMQFLMTGNARANDTLGPNYLLPVSRWRVDPNGNRELITDRTNSPRSINIEVALATIAEFHNLDYTADRADELVGFAVNVLFGYPVRKDWKPFMNLKGVESDERIHYGNANGRDRNNFIGPAQVISRGLMVRDEFLATSFYRNAELRLAAQR